MTALATERRSDVPAAPPRHVTCFYTEEFFEFVLQRWDACAGTCESRVAASDYLFDALLAETSATLDFLQRHQRLMSEWLASLDKLTFFNERECNFRACMLGQAIEDLEVWYPRQRTEASAYRDVLHRVVSRLKEVRARGAGPSQ